MLEFTLHDAKDSLIKAADEMTRGTCLSVFDQFKGFKYPGVNRTLHDAAFATLENTLAKLHEMDYEPIANTTYAEDFAGCFDIGGGFIDFVSYNVIDYVGIADQMKNLFGNQGNVIPRINANMTQKKVNVYTFEIGYDFKFVELAKITNANTIKKSIEDIYKDAISVGYEFFAENVAYEGINASTGLFNSTTVYTATIDNSNAIVAHKGWKGTTDDEVISFFNGVFEYYLVNSNMNTKFMPDTFLVPTFVGSDLTGRTSAFYNTNLRNYILNFNLGKDESNGTANITITSRDRLNNAGTLGLGRIVAYKKEKRYLRIDIPYPLQHYITLPDIAHACYTSLFVAQISEVQMPYSGNAAELGPISYWDFTK